MKRLTGPQEERHAAECAFDYARLLWPVGANEVIDKRMHELRVILDDLRADQKADRPESYAGNREFKMAMWRKYSGVVDAEGEWNEELVREAKKLEEEFDGESEEDECVEEEEEEEENKGDEQQDVEKERGEKKDDIVLLFRTAQK